jgi:hypothetical protein
MVRNSSGGGFVIGSDVFVRGSRVPQPSVLKAAGFDFPRPFRRPTFAPFLRTNLISTRFTLSFEGLPKACATRIKVPIVRFRDSFSIAKIFGALMSAQARSSAFHGFFQYPWTLNDHPRLQSLSRAR